MTKAEEKFASNINLWVVGGSSSVGMLFREFQDTMGDVRGES